MGGQVGVCDTHLLLGYPDFYFLLIYTLPSAQRHSLQSKPAPRGGSDLLHRRSDSEPEAMLGAYVGLCWLIFGHLGAMLGPYWLQLGHLGLILALSWAILTPNWPSCPDLGSLLGHLGLPLGF